METIFLIYFEWETAMQLVKKHFFSEKLCYWLCSLYIYICIYKDNRIKSLAHPQKLNLFRVHSMTLKKIVWKKRLNWKVKLKRKCFAEKLLLSEKVSLLCLVSIFKFLSEKKLFAGTFLCRNVYWFSAGVRASTVGNCSLGHMPKNKPPINFLFTAKYSLSLPEHVWQILG